MRNINLTALLALQEADLRRRGMETRLSLLPKEMDAIIEKRDRLNASTAAADEAVKKMELAIKEGENTIARLDDNVCKLRQQSALVKKNNEYQAMLAQIASEKAKIGEIEEELLGRYDELETLKAEAEKTRKSNALELRTARGEFEELLAFSKSLKAEIAKMASERPQLTAALPEDLLSDYERLLKDRSGAPPLAKVENDCCGNCHMRVTFQTLSEVAKGKIASCDNCQHMLYADGE